MDDQKKSDELKHGSIEKNLERYLETETLLNVFFNAFDYCLDQCIRVEIEKNEGLPVAACCKNRYHCIYDLEYPAFNLLRAEREKRYGKPEDQITPDPVSPCEYHGPTGCRIATHKSPICLSFMCRESIDTLRETYGIFTYDYLGMNYALEWILTGDLSDVDYKEFRASIVQMIQTIKEKRASAPCSVRSALLLGHGA